MKLESSLMAMVSIEKRNLALSNMITALEASKEEIFLANQMDMDAAKENRIPDAVMKRLKFDEGKLSGVLSGLKELIALPDPINQIQMNRELDSDLRLVRQSCPIGVIGSQTGCIDSDCFFMCKKW